MKSNGGGHYSSAPSNGASTVNGFLTTFFRINRFLETQEPMLTRPCINIQHIVGPLSRAKFIGGITKITLTIGSDS